MGREWIVSNDPADWTQGAINTGGGTTIGFSRIRTPEPIPVTGGATYTFRTLHLENYPWFAWHQWKADGTYISDSTWKRADLAKLTVKMDDEAAYIKITARWNDQSKITPDDVGHTFVLSMAEGTDAPDPNAGGGGSMISDPIQLFVYEDSAPGYVWYGMGVVDPISAADAVRKERHGGAREAQPGQKFRIAMDATSPSNDYLWVAIGFYDADMKMIGRPAATSANGATHLEAELAAPSGTVYMRPSARFYSDGFLSLETSGGGRAL